MTVNITGRKVALKDSFRERAERKLKKIERFFGDDADAQVTVTLEKDRQTVETTIKNGSMIYRGECTAPHMEDALDKAVDDIIRKIRKNKTRIEKRLRTGSFEELITPADEPVEEAGIEIVRVKHFRIKPLDPEEAVLQMNMLGHQFYMFRNSVSGEVNVVYKRNDGNYALIEPDVE